MQKQVLLKLLTLVLFLALACRKEQFLAPNIAAGGNDEAMILNIGDKLVLAPSIRVTKGNRYTWLMNGEEAATSAPNYTFEATTPGEFEVQFRIENKGGTDDRLYKIVVEKPIAATIGNPLTVPICDVLVVAPAIDGPDRNDYTYQWLIGDSIIGKERNLSFISFQPGNYTLTLRVAAGKQTATATGVVTVNTAQYVRNAYTLLEYLPAPAKNHNWSVIGSADLWQYGSEYPLAYNDFLAKATELRKQAAGAGLQLGAWGGSATFQFDHTVVNVPGKPDIELTAVVSNLDHPAVYVAYDHNKNGKADEEEWYELKNKDYGMEDIADYEMTFTYDRTETDARRVYTWYSWRDNQDSAWHGDIAHQKTFNSAITNAGMLSTKGFFPGYNTIDFNTKQVALLAGWSNTFTRKGKRIVKNLTGAPQFSQKLNLDLDLAVNKKGEAVQLPGISFIKIQKVVYPFQQDFTNAGGAMADFNMEEGRM